jgi:hypothetical protein
MFTTCSLPSVSEEIQQAEACDYRLDALELDPIDGECEKWNSD